MGETRSRKEIAAAMFVRKSGVTAKELEDRLKWNDQNVTKFLYWVKLFAEVGAIDLEVETKSDGQEVYRMKVIAEKTKGAGD